MNYECQMFLRYFFLGSTHLNAQGNSSAREKVVAGVTLGVIEQLGPGKATHGPEQEVAGVATEDPVVGPLVIVPVAAPARVGHGVEEVITGDSGRGTEGCWVDGLVSSEEPRVGAVVAILAVVAGSHSASHSLRCGDGKGHWHDSEEAQGDFHGECEVLLC